MAHDLGLDSPEVFDPTKVDGDVLVAEIQRIIKALLGYGAKIPKELMLFTKNLMFVDGAIATLAPDLDILEEIAAHHDVLRHDARREDRRPDRDRRPTPGSSTWRA